MTFDQLEAFELIAERGSFAAAAKALRRTQPTLSVAIKKLETELGVILFDREAYRPQLTDEGRVFYTWAKETLRSFRDLEVVGKELGERRIEPRVTIVIDPIARFDAVRLVLGECLGATRATEVTLRSEIVEVGADLVRRGEADLAITPLGKDGEGDDLEALPLETVPMIAVMAAHLAPKKGGIDAAWLREQVHVIVSSGELRGVVPKRALGVDKASGKRCFVADHALKRRLIIEGLGWGRLAAHEVAAELAHKQLFALPEAAAPSFTLALHLVRLRQRPMGPVTRALWGKLAQLARDHA